MANVSYTPNLTGEKRTISTLIDQTFIQLTHQRRKNPSFFKTNFSVIQTQMHYDTGIFARKWRQVCTSTNSSPTAAAARYHSAWSYFQVQQWVGKAQKSGRKRIVEDHLEVRTTDFASAPENLLVLVRCWCKLSCDSRKFTCKKHGLPCVFACSECKGVK